MNKIEALKKKDNIQISEVSSKEVFSIQTDIKVPKFNDANSNQQQRFITLLDVIYDKDISIAVTSNQSLDEFTSSRLLEKPFKRTISRLYELTSRE